MLRPCRSCLASLLKLLNFLQTFVGVSLILYSVWVLNRWNRHAAASADGGGGSRRLGFDVDDLPAPWFVCATMGFGGILCLVAFVGHVAAEVVNGCCLCFYAVLSTMLIVLEAALAGYLVLNRQWEQELPYDPTGELKRLRAFIEDNIDLFRWIAVFVIVIQALSLLLALVVRVMIPNRRVDYDSDEDFLVIRRPLLNPQGGPFAPATVESKGLPSDIWSSRIRQKENLPGAADELNDRAEEEEGAVECETCRFQLRAQQAVEHLEPLDNMILEVDILRLQILRVRQSDSSSFVFINLR